MADLTGMMQAAAGGAGGGANYIEDVFSTYLYTGNGSTQTITNGIDLAGEGGLVWLKARSEAANHGLVDTVRGVRSYLSSDSTAAAYTNVLGSDVTAFNANGFSLGPSQAVSTNTSGQTYASWTFRKQPKFFDVVTYTGNGVANRQIAHSLGVAPGCIIVKNTSNTYNWYVYHRSLAANQELRLSTTDAATTGAFFPTTPTSSDFYVKADGGVNGSGETYVAYLFAHDAGGFGLSGNENVISCGSYVGNGTGNNPVTLGYEPQWVMIKNTQDATQWPIIDTMRGMSNTTVDADKILFANLSNAESSSSTDTHVYPTATGFVLNSASGTYNNNGQTYIYIAIRRGPMKVPTLGTTVYNAIARTGTGAVATVTGAGFTPDLVLAKARNQTYIPVWYDKLRGALLRISSASTGVETVGAGSSLTSFGMDGCVLGADPDEFINGASGSPTYINYFFQRAPSFFDEVCYTGTQVARTVAHNLAAVPQLMIVKKRSATGSWFTYDAFNGNDNVMYLNATTASASGYGAYWNSTTPTASVFSLGNSATNDSAATYVAYLFATCAGVSKVGSYTGTGTTQAIACGFTAGARFVMIKRTDDVGDWYYWDSTRGIVAGNDPYLLMNSTAAEVTGTDYVDTSATGFELTSTAPAAINASGGSYIFWAVA